MNAALQLVKDVSASAVATDILATQGRVSRVLAIRTNVSCEIESLIVSLIQGPAVKHLAWPA